MSEQYSVDACQMVVAVRSVVGCTSYRLCLLCSQLDYILSEIHEYDCIVNT